MSRKPNFFLVGGPKCGTTALFEYLRQHPDIYLPKQKEINYFGSDLIFRGINRKLENYLTQFDGVQDEVCVGEASVWSLYSKNAAKEIKKFNHNSKIIIMIREPVSMMHSLHSELLYTGDEVEADFIKALDLEDSRGNQINLPITVYGEHTTQYRKAAMFSAQIERYYNVFGKDKVLVLTQEALSQDSVGVVEKTFKFLGVAPGFSPKIERHNGNKTVRVRFLKNLIHRPPSSLRKVLAFFLRSQRVKNEVTHFFVELNKVFNRKSSIREKIDPNLAKGLSEEFQEDIKRIEELTGLDLDEWKTKY